MFEPCPNYFLSTFTEFGLKFLQGFLGVLLPDRSRALSPAVDLGGSLSRNNMPSVVAQPSQKQYNKAINTLRAPVERAIANLKTWRTLHTGYRRPLHTFPETITAIIALEFFKNSFA